MLLPPVLIVAFPSFALITIGGFSLVPVSHCSTEYCSRSLRSVPSFTHTTTLRSFSTVIVLSAAIVTTATSLPQVTTTATLTIVTWRSALLEDILQRYQSEYILAHRYPATLAALRTSQLLLVPSPAPHPFTSSSAILPVYTTQKQLLRRPSTEPHLSSSEWEPSQYPKHVLCSRTLTYNGRATLTASMESATVATEQPTMQTTTVTTTVYSAIMAQRAAATTATTTTMITVYRPAQQERAKSKDDEL